MQTNRDFQQKIKNFCAKVSLYGKKIDETLNNVTIYNIMQNDGDLKTLSKVGQNMRLTGDLNQ